jgi:hypothetical protein
LKKWGFLAIVSAAFLAVGCGGSGGDGGGGGGGGTPVDQISVNTSLLNKPGLLNVTFNTGQGRGTATSSAFLKKLFLEDNIFGAGDPRNRVQTLLEPERVLGLDLYTSQGIPLNVPMTGFSTNLNGRSFDVFPLEIARVNIDGTNYTGPGGNAVFNLEFPMRMRSFPGRTTSLEIFLNDGIIFDPGTGIEFDTTYFEELNYNDDEGRMVGYLSDYVAFDISNVSYAPQMSNSSTASTVFFSGDAIALGDVPSTSPTFFEVLVPESPDPGAIEGLTQLPPSFPANAPATYTLRTPDPRNLPGIAKITALTGTWRWWVDEDEPSLSAILNAGNFAFITFPQSQDDGVQDLIIVGLSGGVITECYFGEANFNTNTWLAWPISEVVEGTVNGEIGGTFSGYDIRGSIGIPTSADVRGGTYSITAGSAPGEFPGTGRFIVYRL